MYIYCVYTAKNAKFTYKKGNFIEFLIGCLHRGPSFAGV